MDQIVCNVCMDLIPLVKDGIASEESHTLVMSHISICEDCAIAFGNYTEENSDMDDVVVLNRIKKRLTIFLLSVIFVGMLFGLVLSDGMGMFYNGLIMPIIGGFGYALFKKRSYLVPLALFLFSFVWIIIREILKGFLTYSTVFDLVIMSLWWSGIFALFSAIGVVIAALLNYSFKKED